MMLGSPATPERVAALRESLGLEDPIPVRYVNFLWQVIHGDFGTSFLTKRPVFEDMVMRIPLYAVARGCRPWVFRHYGYSDRRFRGAAP
jgi:ABC-type dipeptide/oligopeptide/nickel transport system permease component